MHGATRYSDDFEVEYYRRQLSGEELLLYVSLASDQPLRLPARQLARLHELTTRSVTAERIDRRQTA
jgi:hypothetical protein